MSMTQYILGVLTTLAWIMVYLTYSPSDARYFWIYWATVAVLLGFGYMIDVMFGVDLSFEFDPNADNWRRKTDPQN